MVALLMSPEEVREHERRVLAFYRSKRLVRNVAAVLMDVRIGSAGDIESTALTKANAILALLERRGLLKSTRRAARPA